LIEEKVERLFESMDVQPARRGDLDGRRAFTAGGGRARAL